MHIDPADKRIVRWAVDRGLIFAYERNNGLSGTHLKLHLGLLTAFFRRGKLTHLTAAADGRHIDQLMCELTELFGLCAQARGYLDQQSAPVEGGESLGSAEKTGGGELAGPSHGPTCRFPD